MAVEQMTMPQLGESVTEGTISRWLVSVGDHVNKYDPIAEVMTDKVNAEVPSSFTGKITELVGKEGETLQVGDVICKVETNEDAKPEAEAVSKPDQAEAEPAKPEAEDTSQKKRYSPAVLRLAGEHNIDLEQVEGTGAGGRITRKDIQRIIASGAVPQTDAAPEKQPGANPAGTSEPVQKPAQAAPQAAPPQSAAGDVAIPVTGIRHAIATNMVRSKHEIPHAWTMMEVDVTSLVSYRNKIKDEFKKKEGFSLTFFAFFVKAVAQALKEFPQMNSMWAGDKIIQKKDINISIAVATDDALYVPVIKHADEKTIKGIAREISELAHKVRSGKLTSGDMSGGTFTVNNTGSFGSVQSMGIINHPQAAILQVESIVKRPVVMEHGMIAVRDMVNLCLSLDHRVLDGLICGRFLARVKEILEQIDDHTSIY
ncbi:dihydrolipoamide acetyltransferase family protein [Bacillus haynesii]|uniref:dihydrolipoamide acetyltransferase family protein n=1 Tax=Bacillus haynesii TaxID=1925021 RepID=UPI001593EEF8|nr:dihydrolipoamide acetyltransferase family protein [Bacillus haynesii]NVB32380.1 2-oxo acid dehydrogenase subunit E2 [Bacillus licheniformis]MEC0669178.1 dihydrolipoamide acetyltransferase family protein [Bacillus haynesii]MEC1417077.1 dihydrolipoamide acetyltransferase family protein [Bacillus haynesii]MEC1467148.1 dihydrolipoamide acetyltransferase family protein [Bacillus haynesii]MEC1476588.1 dihydrolipoamide acetyltransferase family protein [Bacillus haynesii]